jgi:hypothetical protein
MSATYASSQANLCSETAAELLVPLVVASPRACNGPQPLRVSVPLPRGVEDGLSTFVLDQADGATQEAQTRPLAYWPDGSVQWLLVDAIAPHLDSGASTFHLRRVGDPATAGPSRLSVVESPSSLVVHTGPLTCVLRRAAGVPLRIPLRYGGNGAKGAGTLTAVFRDDGGRDCQPLVEEAVLEERGPVRATVRVRARMDGTKPLRLTLRLEFHAGTGLLRVRTTLHNHHRAGHRDGLWDLGDAGSALFRSFGLALQLAPANTRSLRWNADPTEALRECKEDFELYQDSSGGENWRSRNHLTRHGKPGPTLCGYQAQCDGQDRQGTRASPTAVVDTEFGDVAVAVPGFWEQFPKALHGGRGDITVELFPSRWSDLHELQGGEQKTHDVWYDFAASAAGRDSPLAWVHQPARAMATPEWISHCGVFRPFALTRAAGEPMLEPLLAEFISGGNDFTRRREAIDEYGWRNFGDVFADHEAAHFVGEGPPVSHYNNQYDLLFGSILQLARGGDARWWSFLEPLARHTIDIDIYHTREDRAAYNGGLFWHTDHYRDAGTSTHRAYSRQNAPAQGGYGGGPCNEHLYTTGLLHYHYLTGDPQARDAVLELADWVVAMDDGRRTVLGLVDAGPTGLASATVDPSYHGPGRGVGNAINALLDAWLVTSDRLYLTKAEELIRRAAHPADDVAALDLLNVEKRWSYTVFLIVLGRYLDLKAEAGECDDGYAYAQACTLRYAAWMLEHEAPYFDRPEKLEYPTETWAAQELRKANVLALAARHADAADASRLRQRFAELAARAFADLARFPSRSAARPLAILMTEGVRYLMLREEQTQKLPRPPRPSFAPRPPFVPQKQRVKRLLRSPIGWLRLLLRVARPHAWLRWWRARRLS